MPERTSAERAAEVAEAIGRDLCCDDCEAGVAQWGAVVIRAAIEAAVEAAIDSWQQKLFVEIADGDAEARRIRMRLGLAEDGRDLEQQLYDAFGEKDKEIAILTETNRLLRITEEKRLRQTCNEPGCGEAAPPYCARHRGDWMSRTTPEAPNV